MIRRTALESPEKPLDVLIKLSKPINCAASVRGWVNREPFLNFVVAMQESRVKCRYRAICRAVPWVQLNSMQIEETQAEESLKATSTQKRTTKVHVLGFINKSREGGGTL